MELLQRVKPGGDMNKLIMIESLAPHENAARTVILEFQASAPPGAISWLLELISSTVSQGGAELIINQVHLESNKTYYAVTASDDRLLSAAEQFKLKKRCTDGLLHEFTTASKSSFEGYDDECLEHFLTSSEQQSLIEQCIKNVEASSTGDVPSCPWLKIYKERPIFPVCISAKLLNIYPLHDPEQLRSLKKKLFFSYKIWPFPIDEIKDYFGDTIALYFSFLSFYTKVLIPPCLLAVSYRLLFFDNNLEDNVFFAILNVIWATLFLEIWKRRSSEITHAWGAHQQDSDTIPLLQNPRAEFTGINRVSPITGNVEPYYPWWKHMLKMYLVSYPLLLISLCFAVCGMSVYLGFQQTMTAQFKGKSGFMTMVFKRVPSICYSIAIFVSNNGYNRIAKKLNDWENHRLESSYSNHLVIKLVLFYSVNGFLSLFYMAFYLRDMVLLRQHLATLLITQQIIQQIQESLIPYLKYKRHSIEVTTDGNKVQVKKNLASNQIDKERRLPVYNDTFGDYLELYLQFGYVFLFSATYPLASFWAVLNNIIEMKSDAFKLCHLHQRPFHFKATDIGAWQVAFEFISIVAVMTNCTLIALSDHTRQLFKGFSTVEYILFFVVIEHILIAVKLSLSYLIPDTPGWIRKQIAKTQYQATKAYKESKQHPQEVGTLTEVSKDV